MVAVIWLINRLLLYLPLADPAFYGYKLQSFRTSVIWSVACKYIYVPKYLTGFCFCCNLNPSSPLRILEMPFWVCVWFHSWLDFGDVIGHMLQWWLDLDRSHCFAEIWPDDMWLRWVVWWHLHSRCLEWYELYFNCLYWYLQDVWMICNSYEAVEIFLHGLDVISEVANAFLVKLVTASFEMMLDVIGFIIIYNLT